MRLTLNGRRRTYIVPASVCNKPPPAMTQPTRLTLAHLLTRAQDAGLLAESRIIERHVYLDLGTRRFVFDLPMARTFLQGLLAGHQSRAALQQRAA